MKWVYGLVISIVIGLFLYINWQEYKLISLKEDVNNVEILLKTEQLDHKTEMFEVEQTTIFNREKEQNVSQIPTAIGSHNISF